MNTEPRKQIKGKGCNSGRDGERERGGGGADRQTDRQTETERQRDRERDTQRETERHRDTERVCVCELTQWGAILVIQLRERERERGSTDDGPTTTVVMS